MPVESPAPGDAQKASSFLSKRDESHPSEASAPKTPETSVQCPTRKNTLPRSSLGGGEALSCPEEMSLKVVFGRHLYTPLLQPDTGTLET